jgi:formate dehydrogenase iron-sulfur subunit
LYLRSEYPIAAQVFDAALVAARDRGLLGEHFDLQLFVGAGSYVCGEETALLESLEGKRGQIRAKPPLPAIEGLFGCPTLIHNAISLASAPWILAEGASAHQGRGVGRSVGTMPFQLAGNIRFGGLVEVPLGITLRELINDFGGGTRSGRPLRAVQIAGPLGAYLPDSMLDLAMDYEALAEYGYGIGHGGVIVFDDTVDLANQARYAFAFCAVESCGKCTPCRVGAVRGVETMDRLIAADGDDSRRPHRQLLQDLCEVMVDGSLCAMGGMTPVPVMSAMKHFPEDFS